MTNTTKSSVSFFQNLILFLTLSFIGQCALAAKYGDQSQEEINALSEKYGPPKDIFYAVARGDLASIHNFLQSGINPDLEDERGYTSLYVATHFSRELASKVLIQAGANINKPSVDQLTPLHVACKEGHNKMVEILLANGANLDAIDSEGDVPLLLAAKKGHRKIVSLIIDKTNLNTRSRIKNVQTALSLLGNHLGEADGVMGERTRKALISLNSEFAAIKEPEGSKRVQSGGNIPQIYTGTFVTIKAGQVIVSGNFVSSSIDKQHVLCQLDFRTVGIEYTGTAEAGAQRLESLILSNNAINSNFGIDDDELRKRLNEQVKVGMFGDRCTLFEFVKN